MIKRCDFCGYEFDPACSTTGGCSGCPVAKSCTHITCPRCGYQMLPEAKLVGLLRAIFKKDQPADRPQAARD